MYELLAYLTVKLTFQSFIAHDLNGSTNVEVDVEVERSRRDLQSCVNFMAPQSIIFITVKITPTIIKLNVLN